LGYYNVTGVATSPAGISLPNVAPGQAITIGVRVTFNPRSVTDERMQVTAESAFAFELADTLDLRVCEQPSCNFAA
jgi:cellulase/cellobiase CelA1